MKSSIKYYTLTILLIEFLFNAQAQDVHFSQRLAANKERNAAFINQFEGSWQVMSVFRQQWQSIGTPFNTGALLITKKIDSKISALDFFAGFSYINDQSGDGKLNLNQFSLNIGTAFSFGRNTLTLALSNAYILKSFNQRGLSFPSQFDRSTGFFNEQLDNRENFSGESTNYFDLGFGSLFERRINERWTLQSGFSMQHINEAKESFFDRSNRKNIGYGLQFSAMHQFSSLISLLPSLSFYRTKGASETILGSKVRFESSSFGPIEKVSPFVLFRTGADRLTDALILGTNATINRFEFGISYDFNVSELELASNYQGGFELLLIYTMPEEKLNYKRVPCERY